VSTPPTSASPTDTRDPGTATVTVTPTTSASSGSEPTGNAQPVAVPPSPGTCRWRQAFRSTAAPDIQGRRHRRLRPQATRGQRPSAVPCRLGHPRPG
jgi:hypothetical protein